MNKKLFLMRFLIVLVCLLALSLSVAAQKRRTSTPRRTAAKPPATTVATNANAAEIKSGAEKVSTQIKNVTKFIYVLGGIARGIEDIDTEAKAGKISKATIDKNNLFKQQVLQSIRNLRAGLAALEVEFRTKPALKTYLINIQGVTDMSGTSEEQAVAGQFTESGKTLLLVIEKLSDTLAAMP